MSTTILDHFINAVRIVSLPRELESTYDVSTFISLNLGLGAVSSVNIISVTSSSGAPYRGAFVNSISIYLTTKPKQKKRGKKLLYARKLIVLSK